MKPSPVSSSKSFRVHLTGTFSIESETQSIHLPTRKIEALIAYLILHPGIQSREKLATLFWGDSSEVAARGSLRKALTFLRKNINDEVVLADRETIQLNSSLPMWVDILEFQDQAQKFLNDPIHQSIHIIEELYQGDLLVDFYDEWALSLREHYRSIYIDVLLRAVEQSRSQSEYNLVVDYAHKILAVDPANERAHQHLMFCYITLGDRNKALQQYEACQRALQDELAVEPTRETQALYQWIKQIASETQSIAARLTNLPIPISSFVGRNKELAKVKQLLSNARLVTLTGAGGSGKTRLAIHASTDLIDSFKDGVWWVELAPLTDPLLVSLAVAKALGIDGRSDQSLTETLKKFLYTRKVLLVLDNCEHLIDSCAQLTESLLTSCEGLKILATSREALSLTGEHVWLVPALSLPDVQNVTLIDLLMQYEGIRLFAERAVAINTDFTPSDENALAIAQICQHLDGIPLAIELAAARIKTMPIEKILNGLNDRFQLLTAENRTVQTRHQTLRAAVDWSYELLSDDERQLFCRLSVFSGGWTLDAAETICSGRGIEDGDILELLAQLVNKSLVTITADGQRYGMLETLRQYAREEMRGTGIEDWISQQHLYYFLNLAETADGKIRGPEQLVWFKTLENENNNLIVALERSLSMPLSSDVGGRLVCALCWYWYSVGEFIQIRHWLGLELKQGSLEETPVTKARILFNAGALSLGRVRWLTPNEAREALEESLEIWRALGSTYQLEAAQSLLYIGSVRKFHFRDDKGLEQMRKSIRTFKELGSIWWQAQGIADYVEAALRFSDYQSIRSLLDEELSLWNKTGDRYGEAKALLWMGRLEQVHNKFAESEGYLKKSLALFTEFKAKGFVQRALVRLGNTSLVLKKYKEARNYYEEDIKIAREIGQPLSVSYGLSKLGYTALHMGDDQKAEEYFYQALVISQENNYENHLIFGLMDFACLATIRRSPFIATRLFGAFYANIEAWRHKHETSEEPIESFERLELEYYIALCRDQIDQSQFDQGWNEGRSLSLDDALSEISIRDG